MTQMSGSSSDGEFCDCCVAVQGAVGALVVGEVAGSFSFVYLLDHVPSLNSWQSVGGRCFQ